MVVKMAYVEAAQERQVNIASDDIRSIGVDVARYGDDKSVITELVGEKQVEMKEYPTNSITELVRHTMSVINNGDASRRTVVLIDSTGLGAGVYDGLLEKQADGDIDSEVEFLEIHFGSSPVLSSDEDPEQIEKIKKRFFNLKARMFQLLANDLRDCLEIYNDKDYLKELPTIKIKPNTKGKLQIESKEDYKKRTKLNSPDKSDSLGLANLGRYVNITYGSFADILNSKKSSTKTDFSKRKRRRIKPTEY